MNYINIYKFPGQPGKEWIELMNNKSPNPDQIIINFGLGITFLILELLPIDKKKLPSISMEKTEISWCYFRTLIIFPVFFLGFEYLVFLLPELK